MTRTSYRVPRQPGTLNATLAQREQAQSAQFEDQRRYNLLRIMVPAILILATLALPTALYSDLSGSGIFSFTSSTAHNGVVLIGTLIALIALRRHRLTLASLAFFAGVSGVIVLVLLSDTVFPGTLALGALPDFSLLLVLVVLASLLGGRWLIVVTTVATSALTFTILTWVPHDAAFQHYADQNGGGGALYTIPIALQVALGALTFAMLAVIRRTQAQLSTVRAAYEHERALDRLKNQFITSINHELRTPLMSVKGYLVLAREFGKSGIYPEQDRMFTRGLRAMQHVEHLVESILDVRRLEADVITLNLAPVPMREVITQALDLIDPREVGQEERAVHLHVPEELQVMADRNHLCQVLVNLLSNACKYSAPATPIEITAEVQPAPAASAGRKKHETSGKPMVEITVRDYGLGIPPAQIPLLFQRFMRLERDIASTTKGTGLGLALCRSYVEAMGGTIHVTSSGVAGEGSIFSFTLPLAEAREAAPADKLAAASGA